MRITRERHDDLIPKFYFKVNSALEGNLWSATNELSDNLHRIFLNLLKKSSEVKTKTLNWIGKCLETNAARGKLWNIHAPPEMNPANFTTVSDGFMLTLASVLLKLCVPFCSNPASGKILKVDPTYCAVEVGWLHIKSCWNYRFTQSISRITDTRTF